MRLRLSQHVKHSLLCILILLCGCTSVLQESTNVIASTDNHYRACSNLIKFIEQAVQDNGVSDVASHRVNDFPYLRSNRFLASFHSEINSEQMFASWIEQMRQLALEGWQHEYLNLDTASQQKFSLAAQSLPYKNIEAALDHCSSALVEKDLNEDRQRQLLYEQVDVPDAYSLWQRTLGFYPLVSPVFKLGVLDWHKETLDTYALDRTELPVHGTLMRYVVGENMPGLAYKEVAEILDKADANPLGMLKPSNEELQLLFNTYAPTFEIDTASNDDLIGAIGLNEDTEPVVDTSNPVVYQFITYTRLHESVLTQLNYMVWFPARPRSSSLDLLGGKLDGLIWRVTLLPDGKPLLFDSIHPCGCYHMLFPTQNASVKTNQVGYEEPLLIPRQITIEEGQRVYLRIASKTHYIDSVDTSGNAVEAEIELARLHKDELRSLATGDKRQSLYGTDSIIDHSARLERFIFWPMGIASPGAMRQPGNHATAFVGRRHFDDAFLFEPYLSINTGSK